jgi:FMNH2-dependent dimethyl sulfone monooxygenase
MLMMALAAMSSRIGLISTMHIGLLHSVIVARIGANLDALSGGRWGLNSVAEAGEPMS